MIALALLGRSPGLMVMQASTRIMGDFLQDPHRILFATIRYKQMVMEKSGNGIDAHSCFRQGGCHFGDEAHSVKG